MVKCAIFDFDGTLVNTVTDVIYCMNEALKVNNFPVREYDYVKNLIGKNLDEIVTRIVPEDSASEAVIAKVKNSYRKIYSEYDKPNTIPFPGIKEMLMQLKDSNIFIAVNSNKGQDLLVKMTEDIFGKGYFDTIVGYDPDYPSKPDPYGALYTIKQLNISHAEAVYIGDSSIDIVTAQNAGIPIVFVGWGIGDNQEITDKYGVSIIDNAMELLQKIIK